MMQAICDNKECGKTVTITHDMIRGGIQYPIDWIGYVDYHGAPEEHFCTPACLEKVHPGSSLREPWY